MKTSIFKISVFFLSVILSVIAYKYLPDTIASHWNYLGVADAFSSKIPNLIAFPALIGILSISLHFVPRMDPKYKTIKEFLPSYNGFTDLIVIFFLALQMQVIAWNLGYKISMAVFMPIMLGILFYFIGDMIGKTKTNYTIGIRTPWTLSSEKVWAKTHKLGDILFKLSLPIFILGAFFPTISFLVVMIYILLIVIALFVYSYFEFKKESKQD